MIAGNLFPHLLSRSHPIWLYRESELFRLHLYNIHSDVWRFFKTQRRKYCFLSLVSNWWEWWMTVNEWLISTVIIIDWAHFYRMTEVSCPNLPSCEFCGAHRVTATKRRDFGKVSGGRHQKCPFFWGGKFISNVQPQAHSMCTKVVLTALVHLWAGCFSQGQSEWPDRSSALDPWRLEVLSVMYTVKW